MKTFLWGNTGIRNRGCEAIVRSSVNVLGNRNGDFYLVTSAPEQDSVMASQLGINMIPYTTYPTILHKYFYGGLHKICKTSLAQYDIIQKPLFNRIQKGDVVLNIGGDTYCYSRPALWMSLNRFAHKKGVKCILWCCSVEKDKITDEVQKDLKRYSFIFARERLTVQNLLACGVPEEKIIQVCDPAFFLDTCEVELPDGFVSGNTVGVNASELVINSKNPCVYKNIIETIRYILDKTNMNVCLIPHVYSIAENTNDYPILKKLQEDIGDTRVSMIEKELNCEEIKYIISKCRFFIGARTHSTIAAYSSLVPTIVLGYSIKSKGIAEDLFGTYRDYVLPYDDLTDTNELREAFIKLLNNEEAIHKRLTDFIPEYKKTLSDAIRMYIRQDDTSAGAYTICDRELCTGCSACAQGCPKQAIKMTPDAEGFVRPVIDKTLCVKCGKCRNICPVANRPKDTLQKPQAYALINSSEAIRLKSSSGGAFSAIAEHIIGNGGSVFGAGFDESRKLIHQQCESTEQLGVLRGSKYLQSSIGDTFRNVRACLEAGKPVLFSGTPCQVNGLYAYLDRDYESLTTVDVVCHGVPSPAVWERYLADCENKKRSRVVDVFFRNKSTGWKIYSLKTTYADGSEETEKLTENAYMKGFLSNLFLRPSCYICPAKQTHRLADITLGDFWGIERISEKLSDDKGTSLLLVHSEKGMKMLDVISADCTVEPVDFDTAIGGNPSYTASVVAQPLRSGFMHEYRRRPYHKLIKKYCGDGVWSKASRLLLKLFS